MGRQEVKQTLNNLYGKSSFASSEDTKEYGDLMEELITRRYVDTDSVKPIDFLNLLDNQ